MHKAIKSVFLGLGLMFGMASAGAELGDPKEMLELITSDLMQQVSDEALLIEKDPDHLIVLIEKTVFPHVDFDYMARWVIGRSLWRRATEDEHRAFKAAFKILLLKTYGNVVRDNADEAVSYFPIRSDIEEKNRIQVNARISQSNREPIDVVYRLTRTPEDEWRVYDIVIEGVSLLKGFQSQFYDTLRQSGLPGLIEELNAHNQIGKERVSQERAQDAESATEH